MQHQTKLETAAEPGRVDHDQRTIHGVAVITAGEAIGHDILIDDTTLNQVVELGNASPGGVLSHYSHPDAGDPGCYLGRMQNFWRDGDRVRADLQIGESASKSPYGDLSAFTLSVADEDPQSCGMSAALDLDLEDIDGQDLPVVRVKGLRAVDLVGRPAANPGGMFVALSQKHLSKGSQNMSIKEARFAQEYHDAGGAQSLFGLTETQYVASRKIDEAGGVLDATALAALPTRQEDPAQDPAKWLTSELDQTPLIAEE